MLNNAMKYIKRLSVETNTVDYFLCGHNCHVCAVCLNLTLFPAWRTKHAHNYLIKKKELLPEVELIVSTL